MASTEEYCAFCRRVQRFSRPTLHDVAETAIHAVFTAGISLFLSSERTAYEANVRNCESCGSTLWQSRQRLAEIAAQQQERGGASPSHEDA